MTNEKIIWNGTVEGTLMLCPSCSKSAAYEIAEPEMYGLECDNGVVTSNVRLLLTTECCGYEVKETNFDMELDLSDQIIDALKVAGVDPVDGFQDWDDIECEITSESANGDDRYETKTAKGKPISARYQKHFYIAMVEVTVTATYTHEGSEPVVVTVDGTWTDESQASDMEELC
jgi:hypothetical protein